MLGGSLGWFGFSDELLSFEQSGEIAASWESLQQLKFSAKLLRQSTVKSDNSIFSIQGFPMKCPGGGPPYKSRALLQT
eukprot:3595362-Amphidinium_carterae.1